MKKKYLIFFVIFAAKFLCMGQELNQLEENNSDKISLDQNISDTNSANKKRPFDPSLYDTTNLIQLQDIDFSEEINNQENLDSKEAELQQLFFYAQDLDKNQDLIKQITSKMDLLEKEEIYKQLCLPTFEFKNLKSPFEILSQKETHNMVCSIVYGYIGIQVSYLLYATYNIYSNSSIMVEDQNYTNGSPNYPNTIFESVTIIDLVYSAALIGSVVSILSGITYPFFKNNNNRYYNSKLASILGVKDKVIISFDFGIIPSKQQPQVGLFTTVSFNNL